MPRAARLALVAALTAASVAGAAAQDVPLPVPDGSRPAPRTHGRVVDCAAHGAWAPPPGWDALESPAHDVIARSPDGVALLVRAARVHVRSVETFRAAALAVASRVLGVAPTLGEPTEHVRDRWHADRSVSGTVLRNGRSLAVRARSDGERRLWVAITASAAHDAEIDAAIGGWVMLTDHACVCGYDCDRRPASP